VRTHRITMTCSDIDTLEAREIVHLQPRGYGVVRMLLASWFTEHFCVWRNDRITEAKAFEEPPMVDDETERTLEEYRHMCTKGYKLVLEPIEAEGDAVFGAST